MSSPENPSAPDMFPAKGLDPTLGTPPMLPEFTSEHTAAIRQTYNSIAQMYEEYGPGTPGQDLDELNRQLNLSGHNRLTIEPTAERDKLPHAVIAMMYAGAFRDPRRAYGAVDIAFHTGLFEPQDQDDLEITIDQVNELRHQLRADRHAIEDYLQRRHGDMVRKRSKGRLSPQLELAIEAYRVGAVMDNGTRHQTFMDHCLEPLLFKYRQR